MNIYTRKIGASMVMFTLIVSTLICPTSVSAAGVSIDAGLTPAANRWIFRTQVRFMERNNDPTMANKEMKMFMFPVVVAYGLRPDVTVMVKQVVMRREMTMMGNSLTSTGLADLFVMGKYRLIRVNKPNYTFGIAPTVGLEIPTGDDDFSSNSYDVRVGSFFSGRMRPWAMDLNITYTWNGLALTSDTEVEPGDEFSVQAAFSYQVSIGTQANVTFAPVIESTYLNISADSEAGNRIPNSGESVLLLSPGFQFTRSSFILEGLVRFPVWQDQNGLQTEQGTSFLVGIRLMN